MNPLWLVAVGGGLGAALRFAVSGWLQSGFFPAGTLFINVLGSFLLGLVLYGSTFWPVPAEWRTFASIGVLGGFTTFSTFSYEAFKMVENQQWLWAAGYVVLSVGLSLLAVFLARAAVLALRPA